MLNHATGYEDTEGRQPILTAVASSWSVSKQSQYQRQEENFLTSFAWANSEMIFKLLLLLLVLVVALLPDTKNYFGFDIRILPGDDISLPDTFSGGLLANRLLSQADHLFRNEIRGPESFATYEGKVYSSLSDGRVVEVLADRLQTVAFFDPQKLGLEECRKPQNTVRCGRPLGLKFDSKGTLYTVDPYHGLYSINVTTGETRLIVDVSEEKGLGARFLDDLALLEKDNGHMVFYLSDVSTEWDLFDVGCVAAEKDRSGRLLRYDTETGTVTVELSGLPFPNGLTFTDDRTALLMCLFNQRAVYKYIVSGDKAGKLVPLAGNLPGEPDNIKRSANREKETYWVGLFAGRNKHSPHLILDTLVETGMLKRFAFRFSRLVGFVIEQVGILLKSDCLTSIGFDVKVGYQFGLRICDYGLAVEIDSEGVILNSMHSPDGSTCSLSEAFEIKQTPTERHFLLGSYMNPYLGRLVLPKSAFQYSDPVSSRETTSKLAAAKSGAKSQVHEKVGESPKATTSDKTSGKATKPSSRSAARGKDEL